MRCPSTTARAINLEPEARDGGPRSPRRPAVLRLNFASAAQGVARPRAFVLQGESPLRLAGELRAPNPGMTMSGDSLDQMVREALELS